MDDSTQDVITNSQALVDAMGSWPDFHDAKLLQASRTAGGCRVVVHVFEMTSEVDAAGYYVLRKHHLLTLDLLDVVTCNLPVSYDGDILDSVAAHRRDDGVAIQFDSVVDSDSCWEAVCREVVVAGVTPCDPSGKAL